MRRVLACSLIGILAAGDTAFAQQKKDQPSWDTVYGDGATKPAVPGAVKGKAAAEPATSVSAAAVPVAANVPAVVPAAAVHTDAQGRYLLREGVDVPLRFAEDVSSKTAADGDPVTFVLDEDLKVGDVVVARAGARAIGEVTNAKKSGMMGKGGELNLRLEYLKVGDTRVHQRGTKGKEGESGTTGAIVLTVLFGPIGLIKHGKNIDIKQGSSLRAFVADDTPLPAMVAQ